MKEKEKDLSQLSDVERQVKEDEIIDQEFHGLIDDYLNSNHRRKVEIITRAFNFAREAHKGARRVSGEPYIMHPLSVARIVCSEIGLGSTSISASLLHDVVEDTDYTVDDISAIFGEKIANIVNGLTKISSGMFGEDVSAQAENFRKLLLTMSDDIRVILIKIADRLHNMRTLSSLAPAKQYKISGETMYIYAPLAHRLGLFAIKTELEELAFKYEHPDTFEEISQKIKETAPERNKIYENFSLPVIESLNKMGIEYEMRARVKSVYSIWKKMESKEIAFEEVYDLFAVRIVFELQEGMDEKKQCWDIYSAITDIYKLRPDRIRDWVSHPKANGYQALHLTVMGPDGKWIEVQIRSRRMDDIAEKGFAAHWKYKEGKVEEDTELDKWLKTIQEVLANPNPNAIDFLDTVKMNLFASEIFVFTPKGDIVTLPQGSTALDFAYSIHTRIGDHSIGAKVNHKLVPISQKLYSGDQVEILTLQSEFPKEEWLNYVSTAKARTKIEAALRRQRRLVAERGKNILNNLFENKPIDNTLFNKMMFIYKAENKEDFYYMIGNGDIELPKDPETYFSKNKPEYNRDNLYDRYVRQAKQTVNKNSKNSENNDNNKIASSNDAKSLKSKSNNGKKIAKSLPVNWDSVYKLREHNFQKNFVVPSCCDLLPGDDAFGFFNFENKLEVHKRSCERGLKLKSSYGERIVEVEWGDYKQYSFLASVSFTGIDKPGILNKIISRVSQDSLINLQSINVTSKEGIFEGSFNVYVHSADDINHLCAAIAKVDGVSTVHRSPVRFKPA